jgi:hypothetical protein
MTVKRIRGNCVHVWGLLLSYVVFFGCLSTGLQDPHPHTHSLEKVVTKILFPLRGIDFELIIES